jgi:hypothetical protein
MTTFDIEQGAQMTNLAAGTLMAQRQGPGSALRPSDARLAALLESKPSVEEIPLEVWWYIVESLRHSVAVRRAREGVAVLGSEALRCETRRAEWSARAALAQVGGGPSKRRTSSRQGEPTVRATICDLARLIVSSRPTALDTVRGAVLDHLQALASAQSQKGATVS